MLKVILVFEMLATSSNSLRHSEPAEDRMVVDKEKGKIRSCCFMGIKLWLYKMNKL